MRTATSRGQIESKRDHPPPAWRLALTLVVFAVAVLAAASQRWAGVAVIIVIVAAAYAVLLRWARWPRGDGDE